MGVAGAAFNGERALSGCGTTDIGREPLPQPFGLLQPLQSGSGEHDGLHLAFRELAQTGVDVAAEFDVFEIGTLGAKLRLPAQTAGTNLGAGRQRRETGEVERDEGVARVDAGGNGGDGNRRCWFFGQVFQAVNGQVNAVFEQRLFNLLGKHALGADFGEGNVLDAVAGGADDFDGDFMAGSAQRGCDVVCLPERQLGAP
jgi:hypothetical protein